METYLYGVVAAFAIGLVNVAVALLERSSTRARNLETIGLSYQFPFGPYAAREPPGRAAVIMFAVWMLALAPLGSWLSVASVGWAYLRRRWARAAQPPALKAFRYRLGRERLTKDQLIKLQEDVAEALGIVGAVRSGDDEPGELVLENDDDGWFTTVRADPGHMRLVFDFSGPDDVGSSTWTEEYRFDGDEVHTRLIESEDVEDGVVLAAEIRSRAEADDDASDFLSPSPDEIDERIADLSAATEWHPVSDSRLRYFIMAQHPAVFPLSRRRQLIRAADGIAGTTSPYRTREAPRANVTEPWKREE